MYAKRKHCARRCFVVKGNDPLCLRDIARIEVDWIPFEPDGRVVRGGLGVAHGAVVAKVAQKAVLKVKENVSAALLLALLPLHDDLYDRSLGGIGRQQRCGQLEHLELAAEKRGRSSVDLAHSKGGVGRERRRFGGDGHGLKCQMCGVAAARGRHPGQGMRTGVKHQC